MLNTFAQKIKESPELQEQMNKVINDPELTHIREEVSKKKKRGYILAILVCFAIFSGIYTIIAVTSSFNFSLLLFFVVFATGFSFAWCAGVSQKADKDYQVYVTPTIVKSVYGKDATYNAKGGFSEEFLRSLDAFPVRRLEQEDFITGKYKDVKCTIGDVTSYHYETRSSGKSSHTEKVIDFSGSIMILDLNKTSKADLVVHETMGLFKDRGIELESTEFNKFFKVTCPDEQNAFYILTPQIQLAILDIKENFQGKLHFLFRDNKVYVILFGESTTFKIKMKESDNHNINVILDAILPMAYIIQTLHLDHKFFIDVPEESQNKDKDDEN